MIVIKKCEEIGYSYKDGNHYFTINGVIYRFDAIAVIGGLHKELKEIVCDYGYSSCLVAIEFEEKIYSNGKRKKFISNFLLFHPMGQMYF